MRATKHCLWSSCWPWWKKLWLKKRNTTINIFKRTKVMKPQNSFYFLFSAGSMDSRKLHLNGLWASSSRLKGTVGSRSKWRSLVRSSRIRCTNSTMSNASSLSQSSGVPWSDRESANPWGKLNSEGYSCTFSPTKISKLSTSSYHRLNFLWQSMISPISSSLTRWPSNKSIWSSSSFSLRGLMTKIMGS